MKSQDIEFLKELTPEAISKNSEPEKITRLIGIIDELEAEVKKLKRMQGFDIIKGKRQKPLNYIPNKDKI